MLKTPVAFIIFNRPHHTEKAFNVIKSIRPTKLYIIADGPRSSEEKASTDAARRVTEQVDWNCEVKRIYSNENLGCRRRVISGLDDLFSIEDEAIILEDDCLPDPSFFKFCETLLGRYRNQNEIMHISGNNFQPAPRRENEAYYFSSFTHIWGWATWARAWKAFREELPDEDYFRANIFPKMTNYDAKQIDYWAMVLGWVRNPKHKAWSYNWMLSVWLQNGKCILPNKNLVKNFGFGEGSTHTSKEPEYYKKIPLESLENFEAPDSDEIDMAADTRAFYSIFYSEPKKYNLYVRSKIWLKNRVKILLRYYLYASHLKSKS